MSSTLRRFTQLLLDSGLVTRRQIQEIRSRLPDSNETSESTTDYLVIQELADSGQLTDYQVSVIREGKSDELMLDDYLILDEIGQGGMGRVYRARHTLMQREVAVKFTLADRRSPRLKQRFRREVESLSKLVHPNIVSALDAGYHDDQCYLVMEYVEGSDLAAYVRRHGTLRFGEALTIITQAAEGLKYLHRHQLIHRDIKPSNLLLTKDNEVKVLDVGLARHQGQSETAVEADDDKTAADLTQQGTIVGTVDYMAPEQALNSSEVSPAADVYSLGCTFYFLLLGRPPYRDASKSVLERVVLHREADIPTLSVLLSDVPRTFDPVFQRMLAKDPQERYQDAGAVLVDLKRLQRDYSNSFTLGSTLAEASSATSRKRIKPIVVATLVLIFVAAVIGWYRLADRFPSAGADRATDQVEVAGVDPESLPVVSPALPANLLDMLEKPLPVLSGDGWRLEKGILTVPEGAPSKLLLPVTLGNHYRIHASVRRISGGGPFVLILPYRDQSQFFVLIDSQRNQSPTSGFGFNAAGRLATSAPGGRLETSKPSLIRIDVAPDRLRLIIDEQVIAQYDGDPGQLSIAAGWSATPRPAVVLASNHGGAFEVSALHAERLDDSGAR